MTRRSSIAGDLDLDALARLHAPLTSEQLRIAVHDMRARGLGDYEVAAATGLAVEQARRLIAEPARDAQRLQE